MQDPKSGEKDIKHKTQHLMKNTTFFYPSTGPKYDPNCREKNTTFLDKFQNSVKHDAKSGRKIRLFLGPLAILKIRISLLI